MSDNCNDCKFPTPTIQLKNLTVSVFNVLTQAIKTGKTLASEEVVAERVSKCRSCSFFKEDRCSQCGCFIALKAGLATEKCPREKW